MKKIHRFITSRWMMTGCCAIWFMVAIGLHISGDEDLARLAGVVSLIAGVTAIGLDITNDKSEGDEHGRKN